MSLAQRVAGVICNYLGEKDEHAVISEVVAPPTERFDVASSGADKKFCAVWAKTDLWHVFGFPMWEKEVFTLLYSSGRAQVHLRPLCKEWLGGLGYANAAMTMQQTELVDLALDCELTSESFSMARVQNIFERADQVDDTFVESKADKRVLLGETAKGGDNGLEFHEFLECIIQIAFMSQPQVRDGGAQRLGSCGSTLPGCLDLLLRKNLLKNAKRDTLAKVRSAILHQPELQDIIRRVCPSSRNRLSSRARRIQQSCSRGRTR